MLPQQLAEQVSQALQQRQQEAAANNADAGTPEASNSRENETSAEAQAREQLSELDDTDKN